MRISVILPNYNHAVHLRQRINSILQQTCPDFELIILDDCSTDNSKDIIESYRSHPKVSHIAYNETNSGSTFRQWQKGLELASGDWIWIAESDDWCDPTFLKTILSAPSGDPEIGLCYCNSNIVNVNEEIVTIPYWTKLLDSPPFNQDYTRDRGLEFAENLVHQNTIMNASAVLVKRELLLTTVVYGLCYRLLGDWVIWAYIAAQTKVHYSATKLNYFREHSNNVRSAVKAFHQLQEHLSIRKEFEKVIALLPKKQRSTATKINRHGTAVIKDKILVSLLRDRKYLASMKYFYRFIVNPSNIRRLFAKSLK